MRTGLAPGAGRGREPDQRVSAAGLRYRVGGDGTAIVLLHALATCGEMWHVQRAGLERRHRVVTIDLPGHGGSAHASSGGYAFAQQARAVVDVLDQEGIACADLVGISFGGEVGQSLAARYPQRVRRLFLSSTACVTLADRAQLWEKRIGCVREYGMAGISGRMVERWFGAAFATSCPATVEQCRRWIESTDLESYVACARVIQTMDLRKDNSRIRCPTLIAYGELDADTGETAAARIAASISNARIAQIAGSRHLPNLDAPERFDRLLADFLAT